MKLKGMLVVLAGLVALGLGTAKAAPYVRAEKTTPYQRAEKAAPYQPHERLQAQEQKPAMPKGQVPELGRPTKVDDALTPFNFDDYFPGKWNFEWDVPEGPLGPSGRITGTTVYKPLDGRFSEVTTEATGVWGTFTERQVLAYHKEYKAIARQVSDTRGFSFLQIGTIGGDLGGIYSIFLESTPFIRNSKTVRIKHALRLLSPLNYRVAISVSEDGGPFRNYGNPWWRKDASAASR